MPKQKQKQAEKQEEIMQASPVGGENTAVQAEEIPSAPAEVENKEITAENAGNDYILEVENLSKHFVLSKNIIGKPVSVLKAVNDVSFKVKRGTTIGVGGESGCGKTTLGRTVLRLYDADGGRIVFEGNDITKLKRKEMRKYRTDIQLIFQDPYSSLPPRMTVGGIIGEAVKVHKIVPKSEDSEYIKSIMNKC